MGNLYKRVTYVGIQASREEFLKAMGVQDYDTWTDISDKAKLNLNGHETVTGKFGEIYTDDDFVCIGLIIDAVGEEEPEPSHIDLMARFDAVKLMVSEQLRGLKIVLGEIKLYATTLCY